MYSTHTDVYTYSTDTQYIHVYLYDTAQGLTFDASPAAHIVMCH